MFRKLTSHSLMTASVRTTGEPVLRRSAGHACLHEAAGDQFTGTEHPRPPLAIMLLIDRFPHSHAECGGTGDPSSVPSPSPALCVPSAAGSNPVAAAKVRGLLEHEEDL